MKLFSNRKTLAIAIGLVAMIGVAFAAPTLLSTQLLKENNYNVLPGDLAITLTTCDAVNGNSFAATGKEILLIQNPDTAAHTITVSSVPDVLGRLDTALTGYNVPAGGFAAVQVDSIVGWRQSNNQIGLACNSALVRFAVIQTH